MSGDQNVKPTRVYFFRQALRCGEPGKHQLQRLCQARQEPGELVHPFKSLFSMGILLEQGPGCGGGHSVTSGALSPQAVSAALLPSLEMAPARFLPIARLPPPRSALTQHGAARPAGRFALIKQGGSRSFYPVPAPCAPRAGFSGFSLPGAKMAEAIAGV